jgi:alkaline phosphatase
MKNFSVIFLMLFLICYQISASVVQSKDIPKHMHPSPAHVDSSFRVKREDKKFHTDGVESTSDYWKAEAQKKLRHQLGKKENTNVAKNVIFFLGDGMSISTITAARIYFGQKMGFTGEESVLSFEEFPNIALSKVSDKFAF